MWAALRIRVERPVHSRLLLAGRPGAAPPPIGVPGLGLAPHAHGSGAGPSPRILVVPLLRPGRSPARAKLLVAGWTPTGSTSAPRKTQRTLRHGFEVMPHLLPSPAWTGTTVRFRSPKRNCTWRRHLRPPSRPQRTGKPLTSWPGTPVRLCWRRISATGAITRLSPGQLLALWLLPAAVPLLLRGRPRGQVQLLLPEALPIATLRPLGCRAPLAPPHLFPPRWLQRSRPAKLSWLAKLP